MAASGEVIFRGLLSMRVGSAPSGVALNAEDTKNVWDATPWPVSRGVVTSSKDAVAKFFADAAGGEFFCLEWAPPKKYTGQWAVLVLMADWSGRAVVRAMVPAVLSIWA